ncbi:MAG: site-specific integrase [Burkholderiales bacterium]|jgi:integrase|nr:site-specific integrase [Burkholderiales bacterium]
MGTERKHDGVRAASETTIEIDFYYAGARCRERLKIVPTPANLKRAAQHRAAILAAIESGTFDYPTTFPNSKHAAQFAWQQDDVLTVTAWLETWLARKERELKASTIVGYTKIINRALIPALGKTPLASLTRGAIRQFAADYDAGNKRIGNILSVLRAALTDAAEEELIETNPLAGWSYRKNEPPKEQDDVDPFTADEQAAILAKLDGQVRNLIQFAFWTGLRTSELVALDWGDIDFARGVIRVRRAKTQAAKAPETTKTVSGRREVKILAPALEALNGQKPFTFFKGAEVFQNPRTGERWIGDQPIRENAWTPALRRAGIAYRRPYQTRHTYASMLLSAGENPMWVAQQMGHKDWGLIRKIYGRFMPDATPEAGNKAVQTFAGQSKKTVIKTA